MKYGFISDIHGNYNGLRIALSHLKKMGCEVVCLGDIVSENSEENEQCVQLLKNWNIQTVKGQHDDTCAKCDSPPVSQEARDFLRALPDMMAKEDILCVHDNPLKKARDGQGMWNNGSYIWSQLEADAVFSDFFEDSTDVRLVFIGHTHTPDVFLDKEQVPIAYGRPVQLLAGRRYIINPGGIGGTQRGGSKSHTYLSFDQEKNRLEFYRVENEGIEFVRRCISNGESKLVGQPQKQWFVPFQNDDRCHDRTARPASLGFAPPENSFMFQVTDKLWVCGYSGIPSPQEFAAYGFNAHFQCTDGFDDWIADYAEIKCLPFKDCTAIPPQILSTAFSWLKSHWEKNHRILISCGAGESRSVSIAIGLLSIAEQMPFLQACRIVFQAIPKAYPHPKTLLSVANHCDASLNMDRLRDIYDSILNPPPFPWPTSELEEACAEFANKRHAMDLDRKIS
jgi:predicted phosphodiesterase